jgi:hypothetical protein
VYDDVRPCAQCGSEVRLEPRTPEPEDGSGPVGPADGVVGTADPTVDRRVCTDPECPSHEDASLEV